jgi:hypothetical protein
MSWLYQELKKCRTAYIKAQELEAVVCNKIADISDEIIDDTTVETIMTEYLNYGYEGLEGIKKYSTMIEKMLADKEREDDEE